MLKFSLKYSKAEMNPVTIEPVQETLVDNEGLIFEQEADLKKREGALLNILEDYSEDKNNMEESQRALLNILDDYSEEKNHMEESQRALLNILDDYSEEKNNMETTLSAVLNILDDYSKEKSNMETTLSAVLNILDDYSKEKNRTESTLSAALNILDDYAEEKGKVETINKNLVSVNKELEQFIYSASHDLQEPIRMVNIYLQLIEKKYKDKLDKEGNDFIHFAMDGSNRMIALIASLLDYSNVNVDHPFETIDLNELLKEVLNELSNQIEANKAAITIEPLPVIFGYKVLLRQLFQNLISNAIKFKSDRKPEILISGKKNNDEYLFFVKDNGIGIQKEYADKLFGIFKRLNPREQYPGTGIGLVVCKKIAEKHGGKIWFESEFGQGTTFYFTIKELKRKEKQNVSMNEKIKEETKNLTMNM